MQLLGSSGVGQYGELLLALPLQDLLALGRVVVPVLDLHDQHAGGLFVHVGLTGEERHQIVRGQEVAGDHDEGEAAIVADISALSQGIQQVSIIGDPRSSL